MGSWILLVGFVPAIAYGAERPDWAFPVTDKIQPPSLANESEPKPPPGSTKSYTRKQIDDALNRDPKSGFVAYVPTESVAKGEALVGTGDGKTTQCAICHGETLKGLGDAPHIAGRHANYIVRQLYFFQDGSRSGPSATLMQGVVQNLSVDDMVAIAAFLASREP
jgi:cytochrome c553